MGARSQADIVKDLRIVIHEIEDAIRRGVTFQEISEAICLIEATSSQTCRRPESRES